MPALPFALPPILFLAALFYVTFVCRIVLGPLLPVLESEFGLGHGDGGTLHYLNSPYCRGSTEATCLLGTPKGFSQTLALWKHGGCRACSIAYLSTRLWQYGTMQP